MMKVDNLPIGYGDRILVRDISFEIAPGEVVLLAGANGSGKTTLLKTLATGSFPEIPSSVKAPLGMTKNGAPERHSSPHVVLIPTNIPKVKGFTVESFIETGCYSESDWKGRVPGEVRKRMDETLELLGIQSLKKRDIATLSDGEFQKACLAVGLTRKAEVLLLDEPTAFLDVENRVDVLRTLRKAARDTGTSILFSSHDLHNAVKVSDRVFVLTRDGRFLSSDVDDKDALLSEAFPGIW